MPCALFDAGDKWFAIFGIEKAGSGLYIVIFASLTIWTSLIRRIGFGRRMAGIKWLSDHNPQLPNTAHKSQVRGSAHCTCSPSSNISPGGIRDQGSGIRVLTSLVSVFRAVVIITGGLAVDAISVAVSDPTLKGGLDMTLVYGMAASAVAVRPVVSSLPESDRNLTNLWELWESVLESRFSDFLLPNARCNRRRSSTPSCTSSPKSR